MIKLLLETCAVAVMDQALCPAIGVAVLQLVDLMLSRECWQLPNDSDWAWE